MKNKQKKKIFILKHDHVFMQTSLINKIQKSCGESQDLSNTASAKLFQNRKFSRDIPEVSTALYSVFVLTKKKKLLKLERSLTDITTGSFTGTREENSSAASLDEEMNFVCIWNQCSSAFNPGKLIVL